MKPNLKSAILKTTLNFIWLYIWKELAEDAELIIERSRGLNHLLFKGSYPRYIVMRKIKTIYILQIYTMYDISFVFCFYMYMNEKCTVFQRITSTVHKWICRGVTYETSNLQVCLLFIIYTDTELLQTKDEISLFNIICRKYRPSYETWNCTAYTMLIQPTFSVSPNYKCNVQTHSHAWTLLLH